MAELKTKKNKKSPLKFIKSVDHEQRKKDAMELIQIFEDITKEKATMWGDSIIGFGEYHYEYERSSQKGDWPLTGFSPRKQQMTLYIMSGPKNYPDLLKKVGPHKASVGCLYFKKLEDMHLPTLKKLIRQSVKDMKKQYNVN